MHTEILRHKDAIGALCRRYGVARLDVFGSAARGKDFDPGRSDIDLLVEFAPDARGSIAALFDFEEAAAEVFARPVDLVERAAVEASRNPYRKRRILSEAEQIYPP